FLHFVHLLLGIQETSGDRIADQRFAMFFKLADLVGGQWHAHLLFLLQGFSFFHHELVLLFALFVGQESVHLLAQRLEVGLIHDRLTKLSRFLHDGVFSDG